VAALFKFPRGITSDGAGNLYVADASNHTIRKVVIATGVVTTLAGTAGASGSADGSGAAARFSGPHGITSDDAGNLYVADTANNTIRKVVIATGVVTALAGASGRVGDLDGLGYLSAFNGPVGVAVVGSWLYVTDGTENTVRAIAF
jgi:hypothetical protein